VQAISSGATGFVSASFSAVTCRVWPRL
jgi:hypothetical protein